MDRGDARGARTPSRADSHRHGLRDSTAGDPPRSRSGSVLRQGKREQDAVLETADPQRHQGRVGTHGREVTCVGVGRHAVVRLEPARRPPPDVELTPREREVIGFVAEGLTTKEVAELIGLSFATVRTHVEHAREKLGARTRTEAVANASQLGWV